MFKLRAGLVGLFVAGATSASSSTPTTSQVAAEGEVARFDRVECCYKDAGWEEHGPHCAVGLIAAIVQIRAKHECEQYHGSCVSLGCEEL